jgi:hypothetical protein
MKLKGNVSSNTVAAFGAARCGATVMAQACPIIGPFLEASTSGRFWL